MGDDRVKLWKLQVKKLSSGLRRTKVKISDHHVIPRGRPRSGISAPGKRSILFGMSLSLRHTRSRRHGNSEHFRRRAGFQQRERQYGRSSGELTFSAFSKAADVLIVKFEGGKKRLEGDEGSGLTSVDEELLYRQLLALDVRRDLKSFL